MHGLSAYDQTRAFLWFMVVEAADDNGFLCDLLRFASLVLSCDVKLGLVYSPFLRL
jgi:hypothetical protein